MQTDDQERVTSQRVPHNLNMLILINDIKKKNNWNV